MVEEPSVVEEKKRTERHRERERERGEASPSVVEEPPVVEDQKRRDRERERRRQWLKHRQWLKNRNAKREREREKERERACRPEVVRIRIQSWVSDSLPSRPAVAAAVSFPAGPRRGPKLVTTFISAWEASAFGGLQKRDLADYGCKLRLTA